MTATTDASTINRLYFGDNLDILRQYVPDESVDLIYLDPPFNSNATYNVLFRERSGEESAAQITAFEDVVTRGPDKLGSLLVAGSAGTCPRHTTLTRCYGNDSSLCPTTLRLQTQLGIRWLQAISMP